MTPIEITAEGFKTLKKKQTLKFPEGRGLIQLTGENKVDPHLGANAVGKTTFPFDAMCWCLFGRTVAGVKGPAVVTWGEKSASVSYTFRLPAGQVVTITRGQTPNVLKMDARGSEQVVEQERIDSLLGFGYAEFCNTIVFGQFGKFFFDLTPTEKLKVFSDALKLDVWETARKKTSTTRAGKQSELDRLNLQLERLRGQRDQLKQQIDPELHQQEIDRVNKSSVEQLDIAEKREKEAEGHRLKGEQIKAEWQAAKDALTEAQAKSQSRVETHQKLVQAHALATTEVVSAARAVERLESEIAKMKKQGVGECPTCHAVVDDEHIDAAVKTLTKRLTKAKDILSENEQVEEKAKDRRTISQERFDELQTEVESATKLMNDHRETMFQISRKMEAAISESGQASREHSRLALVARELEGQQLKRDQELKELKVEIRMLKDEIQQITARIVELDYWTQAFPQVRLFVIDDALDELKTLTNSYLEQMGLVNWQVDFSVERESKTKTTISGFSVVIRSPQSGKAVVPFENFSGVESQIIRIAGACAVSSLIRDRMGVQSNVECFDEPIQHASQESASGIIDFLRKRSRSLNRSIWVIDHSSKNDGRFDKKFVVCKSEKGVTIKEQ